MNGGLGMALPAGAAFAGKEWKHRKSMSIGRERYQFSIKISRIFQLQSAFHPGEKAAAFTQCAAR